MSVFKDKDRYIFHDDFESQHDRWLLQPEANISFENNKMILQASNDEDVSALFDIPQDNEQVIEVWANFDPGGDDDKAGLLLWQDSETKVELLETNANTEEGEYTAWRAVKTKGHWDLYAKRDNEWEFIDTTDISFNKAGVILKQGSTINLEVINTTVSINDKIMVGNLLPGYEVSFTNDGDTTTKVVEEGKSGVEFTLISLKVENVLIEVYNEENTKISELNASEVIAGAIFKHGTHLQIRIRDDEFELSRYQIENLGSMEEGKIKESYDLYNPSTETTAENTYLEVIQMGDSIGHEWTTLAPDDGEGNPDYDNEGNLVYVGDLGPGETFDFWVLVERQGDYDDIEPLKFEIEVTHD